jgi:hypothetical protein
LSEREDSDDDLDFGSQINKGNPKGNFYKKLLPVLLLTMFLACKLNVCDRHFLILVCHSSGLTSDSETDFPTSSFGITSSLRQGTSQSDFSSIFGSDEVNSSAISNSSIPGPSDERFRCRRVTGQPPKKKQCIANFSYN